MKKTPSAILFLLLLLAGMLPAPLLGDSMARDRVRHLDSDILYHFMDGTREFLLMKHGKLPLRMTEEGNYYEVAYPAQSYSIYYWLADNKWDIKHVTVVQTSDDNPHGVPTQRFMGIWPGMSMEKAAQKVTDVPRWRPKQFELRTEYHDSDGDGLVDRIDVYSKKPVKITEKKEDFYLKWMGKSISGKTDHLGNGPFDTKPPHVDSDRDIFTYTITKGPDSWKKQYFCSETGTIQAMRIYTMQLQPFQGTVPSLLGIRLNSTTKDISKHLKAAGYEITQHDWRMADNEYLVVRTLSVKHKKSDTQYRLILHVFTYTRQIKSIKVIDR